MRKFINIPTTITFQPNLLFNAENVLTVIPPPLTTVTLAASAASTGTTITVTSVSGLVVGMAVSVATGGTGVFAAGTTVASIDTVANTFVVSTAPTTALAIADSIIARVPYCTVFTHNKQFRLTFNGSTSSIQNSRAILGSVQINKAVLGTYSGPTAFDVVINEGNISAVAVV